MILDLQLGVCDIHIPRTGGISRARALLPHLSSHCLVDLIARHWTAWRVIQRIGQPRWQQLYRFAVIRDFRKMIESDWRLTLADVDVLDKLRTLSRPTPFMDPWHARILRADRDSSFERFVREEYLAGFTSIQRGGCWRTFCQSPDGEELGIDPIPFPHLRRRWPEICERIGVDLTECELPYLNHVDGPTPEWPRQLLAEVREYFAGDLALIG